MEIRLSIIPTRSDTCACTCAPITASTHSCIPRYSCRAGRFGSAPPKDFRTETGLVLNLFYEEPEGDRWLPFNRYPRRILSPAVREQAVDLGPQAKYLTSVLASIALARNIASATIIDGPSVIPGRSPV